MRSATSAAPLLVLLSVLGCAPASTTASGSRAPRNSVELQAHARDEEARFARAVAAERHPGRLDVESVTPTVLVDRKRALVYALRPKLVVLDLLTGAERWRLDAVTGLALTRLGARLAVVGAATPKMPRLVLIDPDAPRTHQTCDLRLPAPDAADTVSADPFDRAGAPHVVWRGHGHLRRGGTPHSERERARYEAGESCGVVAIEPNTCAITPASLKGFLLSPPRDKGAAVPLDPEDCRYLSPRLEMPSVVASMPAPIDGRNAPSVRVVTTEAPSSPNDCVVVHKNVLEARDGSGNRLWQQPLPDVTDSGRCPGPP